VLLLQMPLHLRWLGMLLRVSLLLPYRKLPVCLQRLLQVVTIRLRPPLLLLL
jgi:hypothetical protein